MFCFFFFLIFGIIFFNFGVYVYVVKIGGNLIGCIIDKFFFGVFFFKYLKIFCLFCFKFDGDIVCFIS